MPDNIEAVSLSILDTNDSLRDHGKLLVLVNTGTPNAPRLSLMHLSTSDITETAISGQRSIACGFTVIDGKVNLKFQDGSEISVSPTVEIEADPSAQPAMLVPLLLVHRDASESIRSSTLSEVEGLTSGSLQSSNGATSATVSNPEDGTLTQKLVDRQRDTLSVADFQGKTITEQLISADRAGRGKITIPAGTPLAFDGSDNFSTANHSIVVTDDLDAVNAQSGNRGNYVHWSSYGSAPDHFAPTVHTHQLVQAGRAAAENGSIKFINVGDSINAVASDPCEISVYANAIIEMMRRDNPGIDINWINGAVGGTTWDDFVNPSHPAAPWLDPVAGQSWHDWVATQKPDVILLHFLGNDIPEFSPSNVVSAIEFFQSFPKIPDIIIGITYRPSYSKDVMPGEEFLQYYTEKWQKAFQASVGWLRTYCQANGIAYIDFDRYVSVARDGYDPEDVALSTITPQVGTTLPAYEQWLSGTVNDVGWDWHFPAIQSPTGTTANACTDFSITQRFDTLPTMLIYTLDDEKIGINVSRPVAVYIWFNDASGKIVYAHSDGVRNPDANRIITHISVPKDVSANNPILCAFEAVGPRVRFRIFEPFKNNTSFAPGALDKFGTGETVVCDLLMGRPMAATTMRISFIGPSSAQMAVLRLCVGNRSCNCRDVHRYVPTTPCYDLYSIIGNSTAPIGGSQAFHMNSSGIRDTQWRAVRDQEWHFLDPNPNKNPFIKTLTVSGVEGNSYIGKYPDGAPGIYRWFDTGGETIATDPGAHNAGQYVVAYKAGQMDANVGSGGFVTIRDASYSYRHFTPHTFKSSAYFAGNLLGVTVSGETNTTILNAATTAPSTPTDAGAEGEFRIDDAGIYFHRNGKWQRILFDPDWE